MRRRGISVLLVLGALAACGWLLWSELQASGVFEFDRGGTGRSETDAATLPLAELEADLRERFRLRGLPGIETAARGHGRLVGSVQLHGGGRGPLPLPGVTVQVIGLVKAPRASAGETGDVDATGNRSFARAAETGADGAFQLGDLPAGGAYTLVVRHVPYREIVLRGLNVQTGRTTDVGEILLGSPTSLQGEVVDAAGRPVGGARVQVFPDASRPERLDLRRGLTDLQGALDHLAESLAEADGSFRVQDLPPGRYLLRISAPGYAAVFREGVWVTADELSASVRVVLDAGAGYVGRVVDEEGRGIGGARVIAVAAPGTRIQRLDRVETTAASNGRYRLDRLVPGMRYFVEAWAEGYAPTGRFLVPEDLQELDLVLSPSGRVEGTITDAATGDGIGGAEVTLVAGMANTLSPVSTVTDDAGRYVLPYVSAGPIFLFAAKADGYPAGSFDASRAEGRKVVAGEVTIIDWALEPGVAVSGRVVDRSDEPVPYATVAFSDPRRRLEGEVSVLTSVDGRYRVEGLRPATYDILVTAAGFAPPTEESESRFVIPQGVDELTKNIVLDYGASLFGSVRSPDGGPVSGARVRVEARGGRRLRDTVRDLVAVSNAVGAWRISGVPPDVELVVEATHDAWARAVSPPIRLQPGDEERLDLVLGEGVRLTGRVTDERGRPVDEARVRWGMVPPGEERRVGDAFRADEFLGPRVVRTDGDGNFVVDRLESGRVLLKVEKEGFADWYRSDIVVGDDTGNRRLEVELERSAVISGSVRDATTGAPLADAWVYAEEQRPDEDEPQDDGRVRALVSAQTGEDGRFVLEGVPPGPSYRVVVWLAVGYQAAVQNRRDPTVRRDDVAAGDADIDFRLERIEESSEGG